MEDPETAGVAKENCSGARCVQILRVVSSHARAAGEEQGWAATTHRAMGDPGRAAGGHQAGCGGSGDRRPFKKS